MRVIFTGDPIELEKNEGLSRLSTSLYGVTFPMSAEVDISHLPPKLQQKILNNGHFRAVGVDAPPVALIVPVSAKSEADGAEAPAEIAKGKKAAAAAKE